MTRSFAALAETFARDGVVLLSDALEPHEIELVEAAFEAKLHDPAANSGRLYPGDEATVLQALDYSIGEAPFRALMERTSIPRIASEVMGGGPVWYMGEQLWLKRGGYARRTPWHQDSAYLPYQGMKVAVMWIPLQPLDGESVLEVVRGSHRGPVYIPTTINDRNEDVPAHSEAEWGAPPLPPIAEDDPRWRIHRRPMQLGDVLMFHTAAIHGGAPTLPGQVRRTLSIRLAGDDVRFAPPRAAPDRAIDDAMRQMQGPRFWSAMQGLTTGDPIGARGTVTQVFP